MLTKNIQRLPKSVVEISVTVPWADLAQKWEETYNRLALDVELPGFRKGTAPKEMVEPKILSQVQQELLKVVMPQSLIEAMQGSDVTPIDYPQYQVVSFSKGADLVFKARVTERPAVKVGDYKTIKVQRPAMKQVTEKEIEKIVADLFNRWKARPQPNITPATQPVSGTAGSMNFNAGAPAQPTSPAPANVPTPEVPDDNFAKAVGANDLADLKLKIKTDLENEAKTENELDYEEAILQQVEGMTTVEVPDVLVQDELNRMLVNLQRKVADMGLLLDDYLRNQNKTLEGIKAEWKNQAEKNVRMELGLSEIARLENVAISDEELQAEIDKIQDQRMKKQFEAQEPRMHLRHALRQTKTLNLLKTIVG